MIPGSYMREKYFWNPKDTQVKRYWLHVPTRKT
jgi:hypothetical protein